MNLKPNKHEIMSFNTRTMTSLGFIIVGTSPPPLPHIKGGGARRWVQNFLLQRGDKPVKGGGVDVEMGGLTQDLQLSHIYYVRGK